MQSKRIVAVLLTVTMVLFMAACGASNSIDPAELVGTWSNDEGTVFLRIYDDGSLDLISILKQESTRTVNGVTTKSSSRSAMTSEDSWKIENCNVVIEGRNSSFKIQNQDGRITLVGEFITYSKVGDLDYDVLSTGNQQQVPASANSTAKTYKIGEVITAGGFTLTFAKCGVDKDIRITSKSSGISITSGPSVENGKKYVYLKGTLKNTGKASIRAAIGGKVVLDGYEYNMSIDTIGTNGAPCSSIDPLETVNILLYAQVVDEIANSFEDGSITFGFNDNFADVELESAAYLYDISINR